MSPSFPLVEKVRQKRVRGPWLGHVMRADLKSLVRQAVVKRCKGCIEGSRRVAGTILMDARAPSFGTVEDLVEAAEDRRGWNALANSMCPVVRKQRKHNKGG